MKLPNGDRVDLGTKLEDYALNPAHRQGRHKAYVFETALGITLANAGVLRDAVLEAAANSTEAEFRTTTGFGRLFVLRFRLVTERGAATVLTAWIIRHGEDFPRLTSCYIV